MADRILRERLKALYAARSPGQSRPARPLLRPTGKSAMAGKATLGVILAGGRSTRMGTDKALLPIDGIPLIARVAARFAPQVEKLLINANDGTARFAALGLQMQELEVIGDHGAGAPGFELRGPLAGIAAALEFASRNNFRRVATVPVDAPLLPLDLVARLAVGADDEVAVAAGTDGMEPLFALWPADFAPVLAAALAAGEQAVHRLIQRLPHRLVPFASVEGEPSPFANLNTPEDAAAFERLSGRPQSA
jgi:molybdopterin-guanine dinucleotide biosynthesis protein A